MIRILVADDSFSWLNFHKNNLEELFLELDINDYKIDTAISGEEGYNNAVENKDTPYDLIISDLQMEDNYSPKYAGEWFIEQIKSLNSYYNTKIIICSGCGRIKQIAETLNTDYIPKYLAVTNINNYKELVKENLGI